MISCSIQFWAVLTKFVLRIHINFYCAASDHNSDIAIRFDRRPRVINDLAHFRRAVIKGGALIPPGDFERCLGRNVQSLGRHRVIIDTHQGWFIFWTSCFISKRGLLKGEWFLKLRLNFALFAAVKIRGEVGKVYEWKNVACPTAGCVNIHLISDDDMAAPNSRSLRLKFRRPCSDMLRRHINCRIIIIIIIIIKKQWRSSVLYVGRPKKRKKSFNSKL